MHPVEIIGPSSHFYISQRLKLHYVDWGNEEAPPLILVHGGRDHARSWDRVARELRRDWHVIAPDLRGHGDSAWAVGGTYQIADFVLDLFQLIQAIDADKVLLVGHSLGGAIALRYAGIYPERVAKLVAIEGLGPSPAMAKRMQEKPVWDRFREWIDSMQGLAARLPRRYATIDEAASRMQEVNAFLTPELARHLTIHGIARNEDGSFSWKFDNYVRAFGPHRYDDEENRGLWERITSPTLLMRGTQSWASDPVKDGRIQPFPSARLVNIEGAEHWVHHDRLDAFLEALRSFLNEP